MVTVVLARASSIRAMKQKQKPRDLKSPKALAQGREGVDGSGRQESRQKGRPRHDAKPLQLFGTRLHDFEIFSGDSEAKSLVMPSRGSPIEDLPDHS